MISAQEKAFELFPIIENDNVSDDINSCKRQIFINGVNFQFENSLEFQILRHIDFANKILVSVNEINSLEKLEDELKELKEKILLPLSETNKNQILEEYVDVLMCLIVSMFKKGLNYKDLILGMMLKIDINIERKWKQNPNGTYSHVKNIDDGWKQDVASMNC